MQLTASSVPTEMTELVLTYQANGFFLSDPLAKNPPVLVRMEIFLERRNDCHHCSTHNGVFAQRGSDTICTFWATFQKRSSVHAGLQKVQCLQITSKRLWHQELSVRAKFPLRAKLLVESGKWKVESTTESVVTRPKLAMSQRLRVVLFACPLGKGSSSLLLLPKVSKVGFEDDQGFQVSVAQQAVNEQSSSTEIILAFLRTITAVEIVQSEIDSTLSQLVGHIIDSKLGLAVG